MYGFSKIFGLQAGLDVFISILYLIAAFGAYRLTLLIRPGYYPAAAVGAAAYILSPVFANQLIAGHLADLLALAGLPWLIVGIATERDSVADAIIIAIFGAALCLVQVQFIVLMPCAVILTIVALRTRRSAFIGVCVLLAGAIFELPTLYQMIRVQGTAPLLENERTALAWEFNQSASLHDAIAGQGYFAHYADVANLPTVFQSLAGAVYYAIPAALVIALILCWRKNRLALGVLLLYIAGVMTVSGLKGPASQLWFNLFVHVNAASVMRELFHAAGFVALPIAVLCASAISRYRRSLHGAAVALCAVVLVCVDAPALASIGQPWLKHPPISQKTSILIKHIANSPGSQRYFIFPGRQPIIYDNSSSGVDPLEHYPIGSHPVFFNYFPIGIDALASDLILSNRRSDYQRVLDRMSVNGILWREQPRVDFTALAGTPAPLLLSDRPRRNTQFTEHLALLRSRHVVYGAGLPLLVSGDYSRLFDSSVSGDVLVFMRDAPALVAIGGAYRLERRNARFDRLIAARCGELVTMAPSVTAVDPNSGWVKSVRFGYADPALDYPLMGSIVTQEHRPAKLPISSHDAVLLAVLNGSQKERFSWGHLPAQLTPGTALAVAGYFHRTGLACLPFRPAAETSDRVSIMSINAADVTHLRGVLRAEGSAGTLIFTDAFDSGWQLRIDGVPISPVRHFKADGFGNGWVFSTTPGLHDYAIVYGVQAAFGLFTNAEFALWLLTLGGVLVLAARTLLVRSA